MVSKRLIWKEYFPDSWHLVIDNRNFYIFKNQKENGDFFYHIGECTNTELQGAIGDDFASFNEAENFLIKYLKRNF